jgi:hypothetical protein
MDAIGHLRIFAHGHEMTGAPLVTVMRDTRKKPPPLVTDTMTHGVQLNAASEAVRLRAVWDAEKHRPGSKISQKAMAADWGVDPSNITQYLNGHIKLNVGAKLRFAAYLKKPVLEIWPDFKLASVAPGELSLDAVIVAASWTMLPDNSKKIVSDLIQSLAGLPGLR